MSATPEGLNDAGKAFWDSVAPEYKMRPDELRVLEDACRVMDMAALLDACWIADGRPLTTTGSMGQQVIHPLIGEIRAQRAQIARLVAQLKLPDMDTGEGAGEANQHRAAAQSKWAAAHGKGA